MMENTLENKAKFFALYWGQEVLRYGIVDEKSPHSRSAEIDFNVYPEFKSYNRYTIQFGYLSLIPLSQITDEDVIVVMDLVKETMFIEHTSIEQLKTGILRMLNEWTGSWLHVGNCLFATDYLRSKGYTLPWMGLSVETLIEYGWIKLKEK